MELKVNTAVVTRLPVLEVDGLKAGTYRFQLCVYDEQGNKSRPDKVTVTVAYRTIVTPIRPTPLRPIVPIFR